MDAGTNTPTLTSCVLISTAESSFRIESDRLDALTPPGMKHESITENDDGSSKDDQDFFQKQSCAHHLDHMITLRTEQGRRVLRRFAKQKLNHVLDNQGNASCRQDPGKRPDLQSLFALKRSDRDPVETANPSQPTPGW